jgi:hypothetical protein
MARGSQTIKPVSKYFLKGTVVLALVGGKTDQVAAAAVLGPLLAAGVVGVAGVAAAAGLAAAAGVALSEDALSPATPVDGGTPAAGAVLSPLKSVTYHPEPFS